VTNDADSIDALLQKADQALDDAKYLLTDERVEAAMIPADYDAFSTFQPETAHDLIADVRRFVDAVRRLIDDQRN